MAKLLAPDRPDRIQPTPSLKGPPRRFTLRHDPVHAGRFFISVGAAGHSAAFSLPAFAFSALILRSCVIKPERPGEWNSEMVHRPKRLGLDRAGQRWQGRIRPYLGGPEGRHGRPPRGRQNYLRHDRRPRQGIGWNSAVEMRVVRHDRAVISRRHIWIVRPPLRALAFAAAVHQMRHTTWLGTYQP
jgi:hypothetical protein